MAIDNLKLVELFKNIRKEPQRVLDELAHLGLVDERTAKGYLRQMRSVDIEKNPLRASALESRILQELAGHIGYYVGKNEGVKPEHEQSAYETIGTEYLQLQ
ncbi:MAG: hypothetical protein AABY07_03830 [Nanoarchaeota archaeon]